MNEQRKQMIISEIKYWKQNNLLPSHYCDFLITLYARGEGEANQKVKKSTSILENEKNKQRRTILLYIFLTLMMLSVLLFIQQLPILTIGLAVLLASVFILLTFTPLTKNQSVISVLYILSAFLLLAISLKIWSVYFIHNTILLIVLLSIQCMLWLITGKVLRLLYFTISGIAGLLLIIGFIFYYYEVKAVTINIMNFFFYSL